MRSHRRDLFIMRHGQTEWNRDGIMQGHLDSPLTELGREQARHLNTLLHRCDVPKDAQAWVSTSGRAQSTARLALLGHFEAWTSDNRLMEVNVGHLQGQPKFGPQFEAANAAHPGRLGWCFHAPGGETYEEFRSRIEDWLVSSDAPAVVVCHGVTSIVLRAIVFGLGMNDLDAIPGGQGVIHVVRNGKAEFFE